MNVIEQALEKGQSALSEHASKQVLKGYGIPVVDEVLVHLPEEVPAAAVKLGYPLVMKGCSPDITHKTETGLVHLGIRNDAEALAAYQAIRRRMGSDDQPVLVQKMIAGQRELMAGLIREPRYGPCVMFGLGGIFTEVLNDTVFRVAPLEKEDAFEMLLGIRGHKILDAVRGMERVDRDALAEILVSVGRIGVENERIKEIDINPLIIADGEPIAVDALVLLDRS